MLICILQLNLVENLCTPKKSKDNILAKNAITLFNSKAHSDMVFEIDNGKKFNAYYFLRFFVFLQNS